MPRYTSAYSKRSRVINLKCLKHGESVLITTDNAPQKTVVIGIVDGFPWSSQEGGPADMLRVASLSGRGAKSTKDYSLKGRVVYRLTT